MSIWGKLAVAAAELAKGGPIAALLGGVGDQEKDGPAENQVAFTVGVIALGAKMAKSDGVVTDDEVNAFKEVLPLRRTAATWLMQAGTDVWQASGFLSMSMETLQRVYGHHHQEYQREAARTGEAATVHRNMTVKAARPKRSTFSRSMVRLHVCWLALSGC